MFRSCARACRVIDEPERCPESCWMSARDLKFVFFLEINDGYRWRLGSPKGETLELSDRPPSHEECARDVYRLREDRYPYAKVCDAAIG